MRVALVCPYDLSRPGGVQGQALGLARSLRTMGHEVVVAAPDDRAPGWATGHVYSAGRSVGVSANGSVAPLALSPLAAARTYRAVAEWGPEVVHLHEPLAPVLGYGFVATRRWPMVGTFHRSGVGGAYELVAPAARLARRRVDVCCAVSEAARASAERLCGGTYEVLFNGVDLDRFARARRAAGSGVGDRAVLFLGRHEHRKGLEVLLDAVSRLQARAAGRGVVAWIAGEGPETARLRARYPESASIRWLGLLGDSDVAERLVEATVLCAPSLGGESFGMVLLEAMAAGTPVVASDIAGYREAAAGHARLVPPGDGGALAAALEDVLGGVDDRALQAAAAHAAHWSMDQLAERYLDAYGRASRARAGGNLSRR